MKKIKFFGIIAVLTLSMAFISCEEEERGPLFIDSTIPSALQNPMVTNLPGGAKIEYDTPTDGDALFVQVTYKRNGEIVTDRSSIYKNNVVLEGLRDTSSQDVLLEVVDKSDNVSTAVSVTVNPLEAPIDTMFKTLDLVQGFGGPALIYSNPDKIKVEVLLTLKDPSGVHVYNQSLFLTGSESGSYTFRSFPANARIFGIQLVDRWDNITSIYEEEITPLEEVEFDSSTFLEAKLEGDVETGAFGWAWSNLFNDNIGGTGMHTDQINIGATVSPYTENYHIFTVDLGESKKISRFLWWQRQGEWAYHHGNPRFYDIWATNELPADNGVSLEAGWTLIGEFEVIKPSGTPSGYNQATAEDRDRAEKGEETEFPIDADKFRYIRFVTKRNWANSKFIHLMEIKVYGGEN